MEREHCINKETGYNLWSILIYLSTSSDSMFKFSKMSSTLDCGQEGHKKKLHIFAAFQIRNF